MFNEFEKLAPKNKGGQDAQKIANVIRSAPTKRDPMAMHW